MHVATEILEPLIQDSAAPSPQPAAHSARRLAVWVFAAFQCFYLLTSTGRARTSDEYNTFYTAESLVLRASTSIPQAVQLHNFYGRFDVTGQPRAAYPPGQAVLIAPWYAAGQYILLKLPGVPAEDTDLIVGFSSCLSSATFSALAVAFFFLLLIGIGVPKSASLFATAILGLATPLFAYSGWLFSEPLSAAVFLGTAFLLFGRSDAGPTSLKVAAIAGLILGLATWVRPTNVFAVGIFALALLFRDGKAALRTAAALCAASGAGIVALLWRNDLLFGSFFDFGYPKTADGVKISLSMSTPITTGLYGFLLSPGKSVFLFAPPVLLAAVGLGRLWKLDRGVAAVAILFPSIYLLFFARYASWEGGYCVGPRYLVPSAALFCLGLGPVLAERKLIARIAAWALFALGLSVQCISLATSFLEDQAPRGRYYDAGWTYRLSYSMRGQVHLFWKYLQNGQPARLGLGWDRWFIFLRLGGISAETLAVLVVLMLAGLGVSLAALVRNYRVANERSPSC